MAGVFVLRSNFATTAWKSDFADSLIGLCPSLNPDAADEAADSVVLQARETAPAAAAHHWASAHGFVEPDLRTAASSRA